MYILYIWSVLESSAVVWHSSLTQGQELEIERVQKVALKNILKEAYETNETHDNALETCSLKPLAERRDGLCLAFAKNCKNN